MSEYSDKTIRLYKLYKLGIPLDKKHVEYLDFFTSLDEIISECTSTKIRYSNTDKYMFENKEGKNVYFIVLDKNIQNSPCVLYIDDSLYSLIKDLSSIWKSEDMRWNFYFHELYAFLSFITKFNIVDMHSVPSFF